MIKAIIFDFDGVIVMSDKGRFGALQKIGKRYNLTIKDELFPKIVGITTVDFFSRHFPALDTSTYYKIMADYKREYKDRIVDHVVPIAFTNDFIRGYKGDKVLAVASGSDVQILETLIRHLGLYDKFTFFLGKEHTKEHKPHPAVYLHAAEKLGLDPSECVAIEDSTTGAQAAQAAGMHIYGLLNGTNSKFDFEGVKVEGFIENLSQLQKALG
jgi:beta-phosphoglucomutase-like phosphatase (HAD superfamily)